MHVTVCPIVSTTLQAQQKAIDSGSAPPAPAPAPAPATAPSASPAPAAGGVDPNLAPDLGATAGKNPTVTGDCDGAVNATASP
ncbi:hypothetical protein JB92DRAFT_2845879 [Gautieria morchelliformis]|nr:hypothetical protein JB92DRAFT_2845879 [Gautieria morchelliformis]